MISKAASAKRLVDENWWWIEDVAKVLLKNGSARGDLRQAIARFDIPDPTGCIA